MWGLALYQTARLCAGHFGCSKHKTRHMPSGTYIRALLWFMSTKKKIKHKMQTKGLRHTA